MSLYTGKKNGNFTENIGARSIITAISAGGPWMTQQTATFVVKQLGNLVDLQVPAITATTNATAGVISFAGLLPVAMRPRRTLFIPVIMQNNGNFASGYCGISTAGDVTFNTLTNSYINLAAAGVYAIDVQWDSKY